MWNMDLEQNFGFMCGVCTCVILCACTHDYNVHKVYIYSGSPVLSMPHYRWDQLTEHYKTLCKTTRESVANDNGINV